MTEGGDEVRWVEPWARLLYLSECPHAWEARGNRHGWYERAYFTNTGVRQGGMARWSRERKGELMKDR